MLFLVGRHGSGKSTIGAALADRGYLHLSVGLLRRLARSGAYPTDVPAVLISAIGRSKAGALLPLDVAKKMLAFAETHPKVVIDGFPATIEHLALLAPDACIGVVWAGKLTRMERLVHRASISQRLWVEGRESVREIELPRILRQARVQHRTVFVKNQLRDASHIWTLAETLIQVDRTQIT